MAQYSDYQEVVDEITDEVLGRLAHDEDCSIIDIFKLEGLDPWQIFLYYGILEKSLVEFRKGRRYKNVFIYAQPEGLVGADPITPVKTLLQHVAYKRSKEVMDGRLSFGNISFDGEQVMYEGPDLKNRTCVVVCDLSMAESPYLYECMRLCKELYATRVVAVPFMVVDEEAEALARLEAEPIIPSQVN